MEAAITSTATGKWVLLWASPKSHFMIRMIFRIFYISAFFSSPHEDTSSCIVQACGAMAPAWGNRLANSPPYWYIQCDPAALTLHLSRPVGQGCGTDHRNHAGNKLTAPTLLHTVQPCLDKTWLLLRPVYSHVQHDMKAMTVKPCICLVGCHHKPIITIMNHIMNCFVFNCCAWLSQVKSH